MFHGLFLIGTVLTENHKKYPKITVSHNLFWVNALFLKMCFVVLRSFIENHTHKVYSSLPQMMCLSLTHQLHDEMLVLFIDLSFTMGTAPGQLLVCRRRVTFINIVAYCFLLRYCCSVDYKQYVEWYSMLVTWQSKQIPNISLSTRKTTSLMWLFPFIHQSHYNVLQKIPIFFIKSSNQNIFDNVRLCLHGVYAMHIPKQTPCWNLC